MNRNTILFCTALSLGLCGASAAFADTIDHDPASVSVEEYLYRAQERPGPAQDTFREYALDREPCQKYMPPPAGYRYEGCELLGLGQEARLSPVRVSERVHRATTAAPAREPARLRPSVADYRIYFDFDRAELRPGEQSTLDRIAQDIKAHGPVDVTVTGYADAAGPQDYNSELSRARARAVVAALERKGIPSRVIEEKARGERNLAVPTADGVELQANRRVTVDFRR